MFDGRVQQKKFFMCFSYSVLRAKVFRHTMLWVAKIIIGQQNRYPHTWLVFANKLSETIRHNS